MYPFKRNRDIVKLKRQYLYKASNMPKKRLPTIVDKAVREKVTKERNSTRWGSAVERVWKNIGGNRK